MSIADILSGLGVMGESYLGAQNKLEQQQMNAIRAQLAMQQMRSLQQNQQTQADVGQVLFPQGGGSPGMNALLGSGGGGAQAALAGLMPQQQPQPSAPMLPPAPSGGTQPPSIGGTAAMPPDLAALAPQVPFAQGAWSRPDPSAPLNFANAPGGQQFQASISGGNMTTAPGAPPLGPQASAQPQQVVQSFNMLLTQEMSPRDHRDAQAGTQTVLQDLMKTTQIGSFDLDGTLQKISDRLPNATPEAKVRVLQNIYPMMSQIAKDQYAKTIQALEFGIKQQDLQQNREAMQQYRQDSLDIQRGRLAQGEQKAGEAGWQIVQTPDGRTLRVKPSTGEVAPVELPAGTGKMPVAGKSGQADPLTDAQAKYWGAIVDAGGALPGGVARNKEMVLQIMKHTAAGTGDPGDFIAKHSQVQADTGSLRNMTRMADSATAFEKTASLNFDKALQLAPNAIPTELGPFFNRFIEEGETMFGDPNVPPYVAAILTGANEYAKIMSGATGSVGSTVDSRKEARELFSPYLSLPQLSNVIAVAKNDMDNRMKSNFGQIQSIQGRLKGAASSTGPSQPGAATATIPPNVDQLRAQLQGSIGKNPGESGYLSPEQLAAIQDKLGL